MGQGAEELTPSGTTTTGYSTGTPTATSTGETTPADIEATRSNLSRDIDELADKVSPARVVERRKEATRSKVSSVRDKLMGSAHSATSSVKGTGSGVAGSVTGGASHGLDAVESKAQGNPLAAGLVAFGVGMLVSALIPASEKEAQAAQKLTEAAQEHGQPLVEEAKSVGAEIGQDLKESAQQSAQEVKATAQDSAQTVKEEGRSSAQHVKDDATP